jgi:phosphatidylglycerophosphatase A
LFVNKNVKIYFKVKNFAKIMATFFGAGYLPIAPGTFGAIFAFLISYLLSGLIYLQDSLITVYSILILVTYFIGVWATNIVSTEWGSDPSKVVIDEAIGYWITIFIFPQKLWILLMGLFLFRVFDIWKPLGIRKIDEISHSGHAVMLDDVAAGILSAFILGIFISLNNTYLWI